MTKIANTANMPLWLTLIIWENNDFYLEVSENADVNLFSSQRADLPSTSHGPWVTAPARRVSSGRRSAAQTSRGKLKDTQWEMRSFRWQALSPIPPWTSCHYGDDSEPKLPTSAHCLGHSSNGSTYPWTAMVTAHFPFNWTGSSQGCSLCAPSTQHSACVYWMNKRSALGIEDNKTALVPALSVNEIIWLLGTHSPPPH